MNFTNMIIINKYLLWLYLQMRLSILPFEKNMTWQDFDGGFKYIIENILKRYILEKWHVKLWGLKILGGNVIRSNKSKRLHIYIYIRL